jgi:hypothetical protein
MKADKLAAAIMADILRPSTPLPARGFPGMPGMSVAMLAKI